MRRLFPFKSWISLAIGLSFMTGCVFIYLYTSNSNLTPVPSSNVQSDIAVPKGRDGSAVSSDHFRSAETLSKEPDVQRQRGIFPVVTNVLPSDIAVPKGRDGSAVSSDHFRSAETLSKEPDVQRQRGIFPVVTNVLPKPNFTNTWSENLDLQNVRKYGVVEAIPSMTVLNTYDTKQLNAIYHSYLDNTDILCHRKLRMGEMGDGGWEICDDYEWRPIRPCVIYSFGINNDFSFDDDAGKVYGCQVYSFDPSMAKQPTYQRSGRVVFYKVGITGEGKRMGKWPLYSLSALRVMLNHTETPIDVLKMDVEGSEWPALTTMMKEGQLLNVRQLLLEYHNSQDEIRSVRSFLKVIRDVEGQGFKRFYAHKNEFCARDADGFPVQRTTCYELHYVNTKFVRAN